MEGVGAPPGRRRSHALWVTDLGRCGGVVDWAGRGSWAVRGGFWSGGDTVAGV